MVSSCFAKTIILEEMKKCDILCFKCHMKIHRKTGKSPLV